MNIATLSILLGARRDPQPGPGASEPAVETFHPLTRFGRWLDTVRDRIEREHRAREAIEHLESMSDAQLRDIGITRADIADAVRFGRRYYLERESR